MSAHESTDIGRPQVATREEWLIARNDLLAREKEHTRPRDALNAARRTADGAPREALCL